MKTHNIAQWFNRIFRQLIPNAGSVIVMAAMLFAYDAHAAALNAASPSVISYQGTLSTASGTTVNGNAGLTFRLYNTQSGGAALWTEAHTGVSTVPVSNGLFNVSLGSITPIPSTVWNNAAVYLGVQVEGDSVELSPREVVSAVPYAMNAAATIVVPDGSITTAKIVDGAVTKNKLASGITSKITILSQPIEILNEWGGATNGRILDLSASTPVSADSVLVEICAGGADVRITVSTPGATIDSIAAQASGGTACNQGWVKMSNRTISYWTSMSPSATLIRIVGYLE